MAQGGGFVQSLRRGCRRSPRKHGLFIHTDPDPGGSRSETGRDCLPDLEEKNKQYQVPDVRDIFAQQRESKEKEAPDGTESQSVRTDENKYPGKDGQASNLIVGEKELIPVGPEEAPASETDINLEVSFAEQAVNQKENSKEKTQRGKGDDAPLPSFRLPKDKTGTTRIGDLAPQDMKKVCHLALIELTALYDVLGVELKQQKAVKIKTKDSGLFVFH